MQAINFRFVHVTEGYMEGVHSSVKEYYGKVLSSTKDLKTSGCKTLFCEKPDHLIHIFPHIPKEVKEKYYGCGTPIPKGIKGLRILDLGSGSGRDCYALAYLVGPEGSVVGVDMTDEQLDVAQRNIDIFSRNIGWSPNLEFRKGFIEDLRDVAIEDNSIDLCVSNCVVNLSPDKEAVLGEVYRVLKNGGEFYFSDVYCDRRLPKNVVENPVLFGECLGGAMYVEDFLRLCKKIGFLDPRVVSFTETDVNDSDLKMIVGNAKYYSITYRLFKLELLEDACEDYGQIGIYNGTIPGSEHKYILDRNHRFVANKPLLICGNTADMIGGSWLSQHFRVLGSRDTHYGKFKCGDDGYTLKSGGSPTRGCC